MSVMSWGQMVRSISWGKHCSGHFSDVDSDELSWNSTNFNRCRRWTWEHIIFVFYVLLSIFIYPQKKNEAFLGAFSVHSKKLQALGDQEAMEQRCSLWNCFYRRYAGCEASSRYWDRGGSPQKHPDSNYIHLDSRNTDCKAPIKVWL